MPLTKEFNMRNRHPKLLVLFLLVFLFASGCSMGGSAKPNDLNWKVEEFTFTDQEGNPYGLQDLKGKVWVADFIFTNCETVCLPMTSNMSTLQNKLAEKGVHAEFVSFSVDPT